MKKIFLLLAPLMIFVLAFRPVKSKTVSGVVTDDTGAPLPGIAVVIKNSKTGAATDNKGYYNIVVPDNNTVLVFSGVGFNTSQIVVGSKTIINVSLKRTTMVGQEVVITAYGRGQKAKDMGYPLSSGYISGDIGQLYRPAPGQLKLNNPDYNREGYDKITENRFLKATDNPLSTFSIDVDAASYSNIRRFLNTGQLPPAGAVRIEEMVNYFRYEYPQPSGKEPFSVTTEISEAPWNKDHKLVLIGLQGKQIPVTNLPASNLTFLIDVSGSMMTADKLPLVQQSMKLLVDQLREQDRISIVVYAGAAGLVLPPTSGYEKIKIKEAIDKLQAGGSTAGGAGIRLAYKTAGENFMKNGNNRVILCTDGDFNVGESSDDAMERLVEEERKSGVFLTVLGFGTGNYQDSKMQKLADKGNGNHAYIDGISEAKKVLVSEFGGTLFTIAKDVKLQVEFNPAKVQGYRLIGYENRMLASEDFNDDKKDAGEMGSGHTVTALYEIIPVGVKSSFLQKVDSLKYQTNLEALSPASYNNEMMTVKIRYKAPDADESKLAVYPVLDKRTALASTSDNFRFAASVTQFGLLLRNSEYKSNADYASVINLASGSLAKDTEGYRAEFVKLVKSAIQLAKKDSPHKKEIIDEGVR